MQTLVNSSNDSSGNAAGSFSLYSSISDIVLCKDYRNTSDGFCKSYELFLDYLYRNLAYKKPKYGENLPFYEFPEPQVT